MNPFKRLAAQLNVSVESFLNQIENHEATAECAIREISGAARAARGRLARVQRETERLGQLLFTLKEDRGRWLDRAKRIRATDEGKAVECLRRVTRLEGEITRVEQEEKAQIDIQGRLEEEVRRVEEALSSLRTRKSQLASRQANAAARRAVEQVDSMSEINNIFERWECRIAEDDVSLNFADTAADSLDREFRKEEEAETLRARLSQLDRE